MKNLNIASGKDGELYDFLKSGYLYRELTNSGDEHIWRAENADDGINLISVNEKHEYTVTKENINTVEKINMLEIGKISEYPEYFI